MTTNADRIAAALRPLAPDNRLMPNEVPVINSLGELWEARAGSGVLVPAVAAGKYKLGKASMDRLANVRREIALTAMLAITLTVQDFVVLQTLRSVDEQRKAVASGNSRTMKSKHLPDETGKARAADLAAWENGAISWEFGRYADIAFAMDQAATQLGYAGNIRWGCAWDRVLSDFGGNRQAYLNEAEAYAKRHAGSDLIDGPHFEWVA
ncbi:MAG: M15 family peptidase [Chloroflexi bacterium]|nr:M15 family peptidase [Chloroflexota bacterium]